MAGLLVVNFLILAAVLMALWRGNETDRQQVSNIQALKGKFHDYARTNQEEKRKLDQAAKDALVRIARAEEKTDVVYESLETKSLRWARVKKIRDAVQETFKLKGYKNYLGTKGITKYAGAVVDYAERFDVPISLILAVTRRESAFDPKQTSSRGARGLMQLMPKTARSLSAEMNVHYNADKLYEIRYNVRFGVYYLMKMLDRFERNVSLTVRAYNAGPDAVEKRVSGEWKSDYVQETKEYHMAIVSGHPEHIDTPYIKHYEEQVL